MAEEEKKGFVVKDRRIFAEGKADQKESGESKPDAKPETERQPPKKEDEIRQPKTEAPLPEINFGTFIFSLNSSALVSLGVIEDPATGQKLKNLPIAKQTIDILGMLEEKTKGNLTPDESSLLKNILYDLRLMYVKEKA